MSNLTRILSIALPTSIIGSLLLGEVLDEYFLGFMYGAAAGIIIALPWVAITKEKIATEIKASGVELYLKRAKSSVIGLIFLLFIAILSAIAAFLTSSNIETTYTAQVIGTLQMYALAGILIAAPAFVWTISEYFSLKIDEKSINEVKGMIGDRDSIPVKELQKMNTASNFLSKVNRAYMVASLTFIIVYLGIVIARIALA